MRSESARLWECPDCGRRFAKRKQWHSCLAQPVKDHFLGRDPKLGKVYERLVEQLRRFGPLRVDAVRSSINLISRHHFGGISVRRDYLRLGFLAEKPIKDRRIIRSLRLGPNRVGHTVILRSAADVDDQLIGWLRLAYALRS